MKTVPELSLNNASLGTLVKLHSHTVHMVELNSITRSCRNDTAVTRSLDSCHHALFVIILFLTIFFRFTDVSVSNTCTMLNRTMIIPAFCIYATTKAQVSCTVAAQ